MRIQYKGGVWKNSEDEILKAAVMKYGKNQWARIASLLVRKSAKQCKARWFEWLDPSIKKTQWTREEEEKLLHLAKIMPTSWRTIAPIIGRTATQCLEHYEKLLDQAQNGTEGSADGAGPSSAGGVVAGKPRPGDMDAFPESKPARPDPVDMDEDELEMLSEARARLANTKGKKAKRKAREKQLEAAKRLAQLQKRRELKAAGVELKPRRKNRKVTDYATEIPFERAPVPGFYDTREEDDRVASEFQEKKQIGKLLQKYKERSALEKEEEAQQRDAEKRKEQKRSIPAVLNSKKGPVAPKSPPLKRARLSLPAPQISDFELEKISKVGAFGDANTIASQASHVPNGQPAQKHGDNFNSVASTPQTESEPWAAVRRRQVETIISLKSSQTPLRGGESTPLHLGLESGATPMLGQLRTPNPLATPLSVSNDSDNARQKSETARAQKEKLRRLQEKVRRGLRSLPEPENEYAIEVGSADLEKAEGNNLMNEEQPIEEDAEEEEARIQTLHERQIEEDKEYVLSRVAKRSLPIPVASLESKHDPTTIGFLIQRDGKAREVLRQYLSLKESPVKVAERLHSLREQDPIDRQYVEGARKLVEEEMEEDTDGGQALINGILSHLDETRTLTTFRSR